MMSEDKPCRELYCATKGFRSAHWHCEMCGRQMPEGPGYCCGCADDPEPEAPHA